MSEKRENFGSQLTVIFAMAGSAIGLGNIWRFPYIVGEHGGAAFVLLYILATVLISLPVFIAEVVIGRRSRSNSYRAMTTLAPGGKIWKYAGLLSIIIPMVVASYYSVIGGWSLEYLFKSCTFGLVGTSPEEVETIFGSFISSAWAPVITHLIFFTVCALVVVMGVKSGIEAFSKITIPILFFLIVAMVTYSVSLPGSEEGVKYLLKPDFSQIDGRSMAYAVGQSFYSLSLGMGAIITYGSYVKSEQNIVSIAAGTAFSDLFFAILAGMAIMPAVFAAGIEPGAGPGLIFQSVPFIFSSIGARFPLISSIAAIVFFLAVVVAAMTSCISLIEVGVSFLNERFGMDRKKACFLIFLICGSVGVLCSLSFGPLSSLTIGGKCLFDLFDWLSSNILLLIMGIFEIIFIGFVMKKEDVRDEVTNGGAKKGNAFIFNVFYFLVKWVAPVAMLLIFISNFIL